MRVIVNILTKPEFKRHLQESVFKQAYMQTSAGVISLRATDLGVYQVEFIDEQVAVSELEPSFNLNKLLLVGTDFQIKVWKATLDIPVGQTTTYIQLANDIGCPKAYRAVANALGANHLAYLIPCHRILRKEGALGGYKWGIQRKAALLASENAVF